MNDNKVCLAKQKWWRKKREAKTRIWQAWSESKRHSESHTATCAHIHSSVKWMLYYILFHKMIDFIDSIELDKVKKRSINMVCINWY